MMSVFYTHVHTQAVDDYVARLCGFVDDYIDYALETVSYVYNYKFLSSSICHAHKLYHPQIKGDVGTCRTVQVAYDAIYTGVCGDALDGLVCTQYIQGWSWCVDIRS